MSRWAMLLRIATLTTLASGSLLLLSACAPEPEPVADDSQIGVEEALREFRSGLHDTRTSCAALYIMRNTAREAGTSKNQEERMNEQLREVGCFSSSSEREDAAGPDESERRSSVEDRSSGPGNDNQDDGEDELVEVCRAFDAATRESAGPPMLSDEETADLYDEVARRARGTELETPIREVAEGYRRGDDYIDGSAVARHCP